jgi:hypothetical protein
MLGETSRGWGEMQNDECRMQNKDTDSRVAVVPQGHVLSVCEMSDKLPTRRVTANARAIITFEVGVPLGCTRMSRLFTWLKPRRDFDFPVFDEYLNAVREFAIGQDRLKWNREALFQQDVQLEAVNAAFGDRIVVSCDDSETWLGSLEFRPATIDMRLGEIAQIAVDRLISRIAPRF